MTLLNAVDKMRQVLNRTEADAVKNDDGNKAAGTRFRAAMQEIKTIAQEARNKVLEREKQ